MTESLDGKLVRDLIPDIIKAGGKTPKTRIVRDEELLRYLHLKLQEEAGEVAAAGSALDLMEELGDVLEVVDAICRVGGINRMQLREMLVKKRTERGGFEQGIVLEDVHE